MFLGYFARFDPVFRSFRAPLFFLFMFLLASWLFFPRLVIFAQESAGKNKEPAQKKKEFINSIGMKFVWLASGKFTRYKPPAGEDAPAKEEEDKWQQQVTLTKGFYLGSHEVTQEQWQTVMGINPSQNKGKNLPVESVSWDDCQEFINKLKKRDNRSYRLPTEAEWEYACLAGSTTAYCNGDDEDALRKVGWCSFDGVWGSAKKPKAVGSLQPNAWGLYDMHGNVYEWCHDWHGDYPKGDVTDPKGAKDSLNRVFRGGSWFYEPWRCQSSYRGKHNPWSSSNFLGVRLAVDD